MKIFAVAASMAICMTSSMTAYAGWFTSGPSDSEKNLITVVFDGHQDIPGHRCDPGSYHLIETNNSKYTVNKVEVNVYGEIKGRSTQYDLNYYVPYTLDEILPPGKSTEGCLRVNAEKWPQGESLIFKTSIASAVFDPVLPAPTPAQPKPLVAAKTYPAAIEGSWKVCYRRLKGSEDACQTIENWKEVHLTFGAVDCTTDKGFGGVSVPEKVPFFARSLLCSFHNEKTEGGVNDQCSYNERHVEQLILTKKKSDDRSFIRIECVGDH